VTLALSQPSTISASACFLADYRIDANIETLYF